MAADGSLADNRDHRDGNPDCDIRIGDMHALAWDPGSFDVVTSFRGIWGTTPAAVAEIHRVLRPGGRAGITVCARGRGLRPACG